MNLKIVVLGYVVRGPIGGMTWHHLQYLMGLRGLGHEVAFFESSADRWSCYDPNTNETGDDPTYGLRYATDVFDRSGFPERWAYHHSPSDTWSGPLGASIREWSRNADVVLNVSGVTVLPAWLEHVPIRVLIDTDPFFAQVRHLTDARARSLAERHNRWCTFGELIAQGTSEVPDDGFGWIATRQPVVLDQWHPTAAPLGAPFTTVMQWDSYPPLEHAGRSYGMKSASFAPIVDLPGRVGVDLELAIGAPIETQEHLRSHGWRVVDPIPISRTPWSYSDYLSSSLGEFSVVKHGYLASRCGWFSERSACYLASGRAVVTQDTGWSSWLPTGEGLFTFADVEEARAAVDTVASDPRRHGRVARELAAEHFDARRVLSDLLEAVLG